MMNREARGRLAVFFALLWLLPGAQVASAQTKVSIANLIVSLPSLSRANPKPYASIVAMQNMQRVIALNDPKVLNVKVEDLADDRFVRKLDERGAIDQLYER